MKSNKTGYAPAPLRQLASACAILLSMASASPATVVTVAWFRLGEDDPGAVAGNTGNNPTRGRNSSGVNPVLVLAPRHTPTYTASVATSAASSVGSTLAMRFDGELPDPPFWEGYSKSSGSFTNSTNNFGIEAWVNPDPGASGIIASNDSAWALLIRNGRYQAYNAGWGYIDSWIPATPGLWRHFAMVRSGGTTRLYVDGFLSGDENPGPLTTGGATGFGVGMASSGIPEAIEGSIDEVRTFNFSPGQFQLSDLLFVPVPEPGTFALAAVGFAGLGLIAIRRRPA